MCVNYLTYSDKRSSLICFITYKKRYVQGFFTFCARIFSSITAITVIHMASSTKVLCVTCNKGKGIFKCEGCSQIFCPKHSIGHRNDLSKQLEEIEITYDIVQQTEDPRQHPLLKKIDQWEKESIDKIRRVAEDARNELLVSTAQNTTVATGVK
jgi:hypothetical protein